MGLISRLFGAGRSADSDALLPEDTLPLDAQFDQDASAAILSEIDIDKAIAAHEDWKLRLENHLRLEQPLPPDLRPEVIGRDDCCDLGRWLRGSGGQRFGTRPAFTILLARHQYFHEQAAKVVTQALAGDREGARRTLEGSYRHASSQTLLLLSGLKDSSAR